MSSTHCWGSGLAIALVMMTVARGASAEAPDPGWIARLNLPVVIEKQDGSRVEGKLVRVEEASVELLHADGSRAVIERSAINALRTRLRAQQVTLTMNESHAQVSGKLVESDDKTIVLEMDDGRRATLKRAALGTVRERVQEVPAAAPRPATSSGDFSSGMPETWNEERPSSGAGLTMMGAALLGTGLGTMVSAPVWRANASPDPATQDMAMRISLGVGGALAALGLPMILVGASQRAKFIEWQQQHGFVAFVPARGGGALTWRAAF